jgi:predicted ATPase
VAATDTTFISRGVLKNYKSIAACDVRLGPLTFLVGPNGSGKSNFLDALRFVSDALSTSLDHAIRERGGINEVRRRSAGHPTDFGIRIEFQLGDLGPGHYAFRIGALKNGGYEVKDEECRVPDPMTFSSRNVESRTSSAWSSFRVRNGHVSGSDIRRMLAPRDRLYLPIGDEPGFWVLSRSLSSMGFYNLNPDRMRDLQSADTGAVLVRDGSNIASVLHRVARERPDIIERIEQYLSEIVPGLRGVERKAIANRETLEFRQLVPGVKDPWRFPAGSVSDGTLRALGILVALLQLRPADNQGEAEGAPLVGIEEPETALHPAGAGVLFDALREASYQRQVLATSHSADLLDNKEVDTNSILAVVAEAGETQIGPLEEIGRSVLHDHLYTVGELLRMDQLRPASTDEKATRQVRLFSDGAA